MSAVDAPWSVTYHDGSGNGFRFWEDLEEAGALFEYSPVLPETSSSGVYCGGEVRKGRVDDQHIGEPWRSVRMLEAESSLRAGSRMMGTGAFRLQDPDGGAREFIVCDGPLLCEFNEFLAPFRKAR
jgi:hypothetical protein